ncbi:MAG: DUF3592 domain-containing protein, partial [Bacteroidota bacterium]
YHCYRIAGYLLTRTAVSRYTTVKGRLIQNELTKRRSFFSSSGITTTWGNEVSYAYEVDGQEYVCERIHIVDGWMTSNRSIHEDVRSRLANQAPLQVYYDPRHPQNALLVREMNWGMFAVEVLLALIATAGGILFATRLIS